MSINPTDPNILPPGSGVTPPDEPIAPESPTVPPLSEELTITDSSSSASVSSPTTFTLPTSGSVVLAVPDITINEFYKAVVGALDSLRNTVFATENQNNLAFRNMRFDAILTGESLATLRRDITTIAILQEELYADQQAQVNAINAAINTYNTNIANTASPPTEDQNQTNTMNQYITDYNNGAITEAEFTTGANDYNDYANSRNPVIASFVADLNTAIDAYNAQVAENNNKINAINALKQKRGIFPLIPLETPMEYVTTLPLVSLPPVAPVPSLPSRDPIATFPPPSTYPTEEELTNSYFNPAFDSQLPPSISLQNYIELIKKYREFVSYYIESRIKVQPNGYVEPLPSMFFNAAGGSSGSGVSLGSIAIGLDTRGLEKLLGASIYQSASLQFSTPLPARLFKNLQFLTLRSLAVASLMATIPATRLVANKLPFIDIDRSASDVFLGLTYSNHLSNLVASDDHRLAIEGFIRGELPGLDEGTLKQLTTALTAGLNITLLQFGLFELSQTLGIPGLSAQLVANASGQPVQDIIEEFSGSRSLEDIFKNPVSIAYLKANLAGRLAAGGLAVEDANLLINGGVNSVIASKVPESVQEFRDSLIPELQKRGLTSATAGALAQEAADFLEAERLGLYLLDTQAKEGFRNRQTLTQRLSLEGIDAEISDRVVSNILREQSESLRQIRDRVAEELVLYHIPRQQALTAATKAVVGDLGFSVTPTTASLDSIAEQVSGRVTSILSPVVSAAEAQNIANQLNVTLFGPAKGAAIAKDEIRRPTSIYHQLADQIRVLNGLKNDKVDEAVSEVAREFNRPNFDLFIINKRITDPADALTHTLWTGAMYEGMGTFPSNYQKTIDVLV